MERTQVLELMSTLKLYGMRSAYDEVMGNGIKRQHEPPQIVGDLLQSEIAEKQARSIRYQLTIAKLPLAKDINDFNFTDTPINESLVRIWPPAASSPTSAISSSSVVRERERAIWLSRLPVHSSATARAGASTMSSIWSTAWKRKRATASKVGWLITSRASTSSSSMNSAIYRLPKPVASFYSTSSAGSTSAPQSSSPQIWHSVNGHRYLVMPR